MSDKNGKHKYFINNELFFYVDEENRSLREETLEGTLGFVIKLHSSRLKNVCRALKIPKLHGATHRENAYINQLMEIEELAATEVGVSIGLVPAKYERILRGSINSLGSNEQEAVNQNGAIYIIQYQPGKNPRFVQINSEVVDWKEDIANVDYKDLRDGIEKISKEVKQEFFSSTVFIQKLSDDESNAKVEVLSVGSDQEKLKYFDQWTAGELYAAKNTWYAFVPSVVYDWAAGTLQDAITRQAKKKWFKDDYIRFLDEIASGIASLHEEGFIHADIRPANIMYFGDTESAPKKPENYKLGDYGSFASASDRFYEKLVNPGGRTRLARAFEGERISEFYAPERISGVERETVDMAYIFKPGPYKEEKLNNFWIVLGLKNQELMQDLDKIKEIITELDRVSVPPDANSATSNGESFDLEAKFERKITKSENKLERRDRIQIQNYIFELKDREIHQNGLQIFKCEGAPTQVMQKRIAVDTDLEEIPPHLAVDRIIELKQWSAAVDLYSLGVLTLYIVFMDQFQDLSQLEITEIKNAEDKFRSMIRTLSDKDYFQTLWPQLEAFRNAFEINSTNSASLPPRFPADDYNVGIEDVQEADSRRKIASTTPTYKDFAKSLVTRVTAYVPGAKRLLEQLDDNVALFLLFLHFALCCLHRENHVTESEKVFLPWMNSEEKKPVFPFSKDRIEPINGEAIGKARARLKVLNGIVFRDAVKAFKLEPNEMEQIPEYNPGNPGMILYQKVQLENKIKEIKQKMDLFIGEGKEEYGEIFEDSKIDYRDQNGKNLLDIFNSYQQMSKSSLMNLFVPPIENELMTTFTKMLKEFLEMSDDIRKALEEHGQPDPD